MKTKFSSPVLYEGNIYGFDEAILACIDAATGDLKWKGGRYGYGQVLLASGHLIVTTETGEVALVKATPESHQEAGAFSGVVGQDLEQSSNLQWHAAGPQHDGDGLLPYRRRTPIELKYR